MTELIRLLFVSDTFILRVSINLCLNENIIERFFVAVLEHLLELLAVVVGARRGTVYVCADDGNIISLRVFSAIAELALYGLLGLSIT